MLPRSEGLMVIVGVVLAVAAGVLGYYFSGREALATVAATAGTLLVCTVVFNFVRLKNASRRVIAPADTPAPEARTTSRRAILRSAFFYLTLGSLTVIWSGLWFWYLSRHAPLRDSVWYICGGLILTGLLLMAISGLILRLRHNVLPGG